MVRPENLRLPSALTSKPAIRLRWLGTAGFEIEHDGYVILIDPYLTRASIRRSLLSAELQPDVGAVMHHIGRADAIIVSHTHFDHALDVPLIARLTGATVFGSRAAVALCAAAGIDSSKLVQVESVLGREVLKTAGPFELRFFPGAHAPIVLGRVPLTGDIPRDVRLPMSGRRYRCGAVLGVALRAAERTIVHLGSGNFLDPASAAPEGPMDLMLLPVSGWQAAPGWVPRAMARLAPQSVLLSHWDDFFRAIHYRERPLRGLELDSLLDQLTASNSRRQIGTLPMLGETSL